MRFKDANLKNKKNILCGLAILLVGLFFSFRVLPVSAADCPAKRDSLFSRYFYPFVRSVEKAARTFGLEVALATAPDPDICGSDSVICAGNGTAGVTISWVSILDSYRSRPTDCFYPFNWATYYYVLFLRGGPGMGTYNSGQNTFYIINSGLSINTTYSWSVEAYDAYGANSVFCTSKPSGSFRTPNCVPPPTVTLTANGVRPQIKIAEGWSVNLNWTSANADSCTASGAWSGNVPVQDQTPAYTFIPSFGIYTYTIQCTGPGGQSSPSSVIVDVVRPVLTLSRGSQTCLAVNLSWSWNDPFFNNEYSQYRVLRSDDGLVFSERAVVSAPRMIYQDNDTFISDQTHYYQIEALKPGFSSVVSNVIQTVPCPRLPGWEEIRPR